MTDSLFFIIPISLILFSVIVISILIWRKASYIKKLAIAEGGVGTSVESKNFLIALFGGLAPEMMETFKKFKLHEYKEAWLLELEKFLRRLRLLSLRVDRLSDSWIYKIRKGYQSTENTVESVKAEESSVAPVVKAEEKPSENEWLRKEEQRLIIEIAKNPKDARLYDSLGDLYVKMGEYNDAKESFAAAIELDPNNAELKKKLSLSSQK